MEVVYSQHSSNWEDQFRVMKRWYYRKSFDWWGHPSNHHWKYFSLGEGEGYKPSFIERHFSGLREGERDLWGGGYYMPHSSERIA